MTHPTSNPGLVKRAGDQTRAPIEACHGGTGAVDWTEVLGEHDLPNRGLKFLHKDLLPPGTSIGLHPHPDDEEYYYILEGTGRLTLNGATVEVGPGDIHGVLPGGTHALENTGHAPLRFLVICVHPR